MDSSMPSQTKPTHPETIQSQLAALSGHAGVYTLSGTGWLRVTGSDRLRWLAGMLTNGIQQQETPQIEMGVGSYSFILSPQGRIQGDCYTFVLTDDVLLETSSEQLQPLQNLLERFIIMDDVELTDISGEWHGIGIAGPKAANILIGTIPAAVGINGMQPLQLRVDESKLMLIAAYSPTIPRFEVWCNDLTEASAIRSALIAAGATDCDSEAIEDLRILSGIPRYGTDIRDKDLPQETAQTRALNFSKGCYIGQEIVERIRSRGAVHRTFTGFLIDGDLPAPNTALELDGKAVGEITSAAVIPLQHGEKKIALGYIRREALTHKKPLTYLGGNATPVELPFVLDNS
jgi:folate-binding protein YgfZ